MSLMDFFTRRNSAPAARDRLQILLAHERWAGGDSNLINRLQEEILPVIAWLTIPMESDWKLAHSRASWQSAIYELSYPFN